MLILMKYMPKRHYKGEKAMNKKGFTLMELMITVAIIGIIAAIAIPAYRGYLQRGRMAQAYADIQTIALANEKCFAEKNSYNTFAYLSNSFGLRITQNPTYYGLNITLLSGNTQFVIYASPSANSGAIRRTPCMRSDGLQGYSAGVPAALTDCVQEEWRGK
jgi:prepilin-type N-terminal cleavage/methylation domain-containing protein